MTMPIDNEIPVSIFVDCSTGETTVTPLTADEIAAQQARQAQAQTDMEARLAKEQAQASAVASAQSKLASLGLTENEITALLGKNN